MKNKTKQNLVDFDFLEIIIFLKLFHYFTARMKLMVGLTFFQKLLFWN